MDIKLLLEARKGWQFLSPHKIHPRAEVIHLRKAIGKYENFIKSLPDSITMEIENKVIGACQR